MFQIATKIVKWISVPALLLASLFTRPATHELLVGFLICLAALIVVQRAVWVKEYFWAAGFVGIAMAFSPLPLVMKVFFLLGFTCIAAFGSLLAAWTMKAAPAAVLILAVVATLPARGFAQTSDSITVKDKLRFHGNNVYSPLALAGDAAYAAALQQLDSPHDWGQGAGAYGKRFGSTVAWSGIRNSLAFSLDSTLHQDPRYHRAGGAGFWRRSGLALRGTILTRTDSGGETFSTWRIGSAYSSAYITNQWYPDRLNTVRLGFIQGSVTLGFDLLSNLGAEFGPDIKRLVRRK